MFVPFVAIYLASFTWPVVLEQGVHEVSIRKFDLPVLADAEDRKMCEGYRLWVSVDHGKTWKHHETKPADTTRFSFTAPTDGHYWFRLQVVAKDSKTKPFNLEDAAADQKVYVNVERRQVVRPHVVASKQMPLSAEKTKVEDLQREVHELRATVERLQKRLAELEKSRDPN
jgi:hypothetical protein